jgi:hypothetical protein
MAKVREDLSLFSVIMNVNKKRIKERSPDIIKAEKKVENALIFVKSKYPRKTRYTNRKGMK